MSDKREPKKSETIEIRLSHDAKRAFMGQCLNDDVSASEAIRAMIDARIANHRQTPSSRKGRGRTILTIAVGMVLGAGVAAPVLAHASQTNHAVFDRLDLNHDGVLNYDEFRNR